MDIDTAVDRYKKLAERRDANNKKLCEALAALSINDRTVAILNDMFDAKDAPVKAERKKLDKLWKWGLNLMDAVSGKMYLCRSSNIGKLTHRLRSELESAAKGF